MTETTHPALKESISALVDGEHNELDLQRVLKEGDDQQTRSTWKRYHLVSSVIRGEYRDNSVGNYVNLGISRDLSGAVSEAIADEAPALTRKRFAGVDGWWVTLGKTSIAATVAFGVFFGVQQYAVAPDPSENIIAADISDIDTNTASGAVVPKGFELPPLTARTVSTDSLSSKSNPPRSAIKKLPQSSIIINSDEFQNQINRLMLKHAEQVSSSGAMGVIPFARVSEISEGEKD